MSDKTTENQAETGFQIIRIYLKDVSLELPNSPEIFAQNSQPNFNVQLTSQATQVNEETCEIVLRITVRADLADERTVFLIEVQQAGLFSYKGLNDMQVAHLQNAYCPTILFPYAREVIDSLLVRAGVPPMQLAPVNFDAVFAQRLQQQQQESAND